MYQGGTLNYLKLLEWAKLQLIYSWYVQKFRKFDLAYLTVLVIWLVEWLFVVEYLFGEWNRVYLVFPIRIPFLLAVGLVYWFFLWGMAVWRRAQFGRFTRGDRTLWAKGYTAFWVAELITLLSFVLIYLWLSWGPYPLVPRVFIVPRRGIVLEFIIYSYLIFLAYVAKFNMRWNLWNFQLVIALLIIIILSYLLWRDVLILATRDSLVNNYGARWRNVKLTALVYSLSHEWWVNHIVGGRSTCFKHISLLQAFKMGQHPLTNFIFLTDYESNQWLNNIDKDQRLLKLYLGCGNILNIDNYYQEFSHSAGNSRFYPRRVGFIGKRIAMWEFLTFLKIWHQLLILMWWVLYIYRLNSRRGGSYPLLSVCYFNIYCCYIIGVMLYLVNWMTTFEALLRFRPGVFSLLRFRLMVEEGFWYCFEGFKTFSRVGAESSMVTIYKV